MRKSRKENTFRNGVVLVSSGLLALIMCFTCSEAESRHLEVLEYMLWSV